MSYSLHNKRMSGLKITSATYSLPSGSSSVDVTNAVIANIKDGKLSIPSVSPAALNVTDPAPGQPKVLTINYTINGGSSITKAANDGDYIDINAPPQRVASGLEIDKAEYGYTGNFTDVTDAVKKYIKNGSIDLKVGFNNVGIPDPNPNKQKELSVTYSINGAQNSHTVKDGDVFKVSAPAVTSSDGTTNRQHALNGMGIIFVNFGWFVSVFIQIINIIACARISLNWINTSIVGIGIGLIPTSYLTIILPILFFRSLIFGTNALTDRVKAPVEFSNYALNYLATIV